MHIGIILASTYNSRNGPFSLGFIYNAYPKAYLIKSTMMNLFTAPFSVKMFEQADLRLYSLPELTQKIIELNVFCAFHCY
jgi:hypothetical protein